jgi:hypothetical protein
MIQKTKLLFVGLVISLTSFTAKNAQNQANLNGAWHYQENTIEQTLLLSDGYFMHTIFDKVNKKFIQSRGGTYIFSGNKLLTNIEFNTLDQNQIGQTISYDFVINKEKLSSDLNGKTVAWNLLDQGKGELRGTWRMSGRMQDGKIADYPRRARKTLKVLTGSHFQWAAINAETKEFFGTGGGSYSFKNGKYTESIEFFSRDNSRVGASLSFDGKLVDGKWHHSGQSSTGNPIYEIWSRDNQN